MIEGIGFYCGLTMRWFRDAFCEPTKSNGRPSGRWTCTTSWPSGRPAVPPGSNGVLGIFSNVMHAEPLDPRVARLRAVRHLRPRRTRARTSASARSRRPRPTSRAATAASSRRSPGAVPDEIVFTGGASNGAHVAADPRRRARRPRARAGGQGVDRPRRGDLRRASARASTRRSTTSTGWCGSSAPSSPTRSRWRPTRSCTRHGSRSTDACSSWLPTGSCARSGARPEPEDRTEGRERCPKQTPKARRTSTSTSRRRRPASS